MVHVCLNELKSFILDHPSRLWVNQLLEFFHLISGDSLAVLGRLESLFKDILDVSHALNALSHSQAEVSEPLVVDCDGPVLAEELYDVWNDSLIVSSGQ